MSLIEVHLSAQHAEHDIKASRLGGQQSSWVYSKMTVTGFKGKGQYQAESCGNLAYQL